MIGLLCNDTLEQVGHLLFNNFRLALYNYFGAENFKEVKNINDLDGIEKLIIVDEHFLYNKQVWFNDNFINTTNNKNIKVLVFNFERIYNSSFPWNVDLQNKLTAFNNIHQIVSDIDDATVLNKVFVNKQRLSKSTNFGIEIKEDKIDKILFIGQLEGNQYTARRNIINALQQNGMEIDILKSDRKLGYTEYLDKINQYKYILNPLGTGKFINLRFYEALYFNTIPIQQVTSEILKWNPDISDHCITFSEDLIIPNLDKPQPSKSLYLEDFFKDINIEGLL